MKEMRAAQWIQVKRVGSGRSSDAGTAGTVAAFAGIGVLLVTAGWGWWTVPGVAAIAFGAAIVLGPLSILVGDDGVRFPGGRFVPWSSVESIATSKDGVVLQLYWGDAIRVVPRGTDLAVELERRLSEWRAADDREPPSVLARGGRRADAWVTSLRALAPLGSGYRSPTVAPERLLDVLLTPRASEDARVAALVALGASLDDARRSTLRELAAASASARVRAVAEAVAAGADDASLARALAG
jgi:hypothetical protein